LKKKAEILKRFFRARESLYKRLLDSGMHDYTIFTVSAIFIGGIVGLAAVFFHETIEVLFNFFFKDFVFNNPFGYWVLIFIPAIGMLIQSVMIKLFPETAKKKGVTEVIKAVALRGGLIRFRTTLFHFIAPAINMGFGGNVGPEGPAAQIGGGIASKLGQLFGFSDARRRIFTAAGAGAAIAAVFNTPLGGVFFAFEVILLHDFQSATFSGLILASVTASAVTRIFLGNEPAFVFGATDIGDYNQFYLYIFLGIFTGIISSLYISYSEKIGGIIKDKVLKIFPQWLVMVAVGLALGVAGYFYPDVLGIGYDAINNMLASSYPLQIVIILTLLKFVFVPLILSAGGFGGIFAPSLFIGAGAGFIFATALNSLFGLNVDVTTYALVSMGAVLGGINFIPIASILIIFEMTRDYSIIIPLMLSVIVSTIIVQLIVKESVHLKHLEKNGLSITGGRQLDILRSIPVRDIMRKNFILIKEYTSLPELVGKYIKSENKTIYVVNENEKLIGVISETEIRPIITEYETVKDLFVAADIANRNFPELHEHDNLEYAMQIFAKSDYDELPVIDEETGELIGTLSRQDVINAYTKESFKQNLAEGLAVEIKTIDYSRWSKVADGYSIFELRVPSSFIGKTLPELKIRNKFGVEVLMIKQKSNLIEENEKIIFPDTNYRFQPDDILVLFGSDENLKKIKELA
jgi:CIC family chloride channel protein